jgi:hypothetical protein
MTSTFALATGKIAEYLLDIALLRSHLQILRR